MDHIQSRINKLVSDGCGAVEWQDYISKLKQQHVDQKHLLQVYNYAISTLASKQSRPPDVAYKKIYIGYANMQRYVLNYHLPTIVSTRVSPHMLNRF